MRLKWHPWSVKDGDHSCGLFFSWRRPSGVRVVALGFGWDEEQPLRPWPQLSTRPTPKGNTGWCLVWCGVYLQVRRGG